MNLFTTGAEFSAALLEASFGLVLIVKWTVLLALAWLGHGMLAERNPRWRVALWRSTVAGLALVAVFSAVPPFMMYHLVPRDQPLIAVAPMIPTAPAVEVRGDPEVVPVRDRIEVIRPAPSFAPPVRTVSHGAPAPAMPQGFRWQARIVPWLFSIWLAGVLVLTARLILGTRGLARVLRRSSAVPDRIVGECRLIAGRLGCRGPVRVRRTADVATPCLAGLWRPVVLLPERECDEARADDLRAILAHELAHARNHDLAWNRTAHVASIVLWFHPLAWRIRAAHAAACDAVCDAVAADLLGDVASYGRTLARLAVRAAWPSPAHGLAMARTSDVRRRIAALNRTVYQAPLSWRRVMPAVFVASSLLVVIGGFGFTRAEHAASAVRDEPAKAASTPKAGNEAKPADQVQAGKLTLRAVAAETGLPIEGVSIAYRRSRPDGTNEQGAVTTGKDGVATINYPPTFKTGYFEITARKPKLVPMYLLWDDKRHPLELPLTKVLRFEPGTTIGGVVRDEAGGPIAGAMVSVYAPPTECEGTNHIATLGELKTDARGRWRLDVAPRNLGGVWLSVEHPRYRRNSGAVSRDLDRAINLTKGPAVSGRVVDAAGRPIKGARAIIHQDASVLDPPAGTTNAQGEFILENCDAGPSFIMVQAEGFAPEIRDVRVERQTAPVEIRLTEPGSVVRGKVVDIEGKPVAGAFFGAATWRGRRPIDFQVRTGADGRFEWKNAPKDVVFYDAGKFGFMSTRKVPLTATDREQVITIYPELVITGRVSDAETGRPLSTFRLIRGQRDEGRNETDWAENEAVDITGGRYTIRFGEPWGPFVVRVKAPGYQTADSRAFRFTERNPTFDFALRRGKEPLSGVVLLPDGKSALGAEVVVDTREMGYLMQAGKFDRRANIPSVTTGLDGRFAFSAPADKFLLIAMSDAGYADASPEEFAKSRKLVLRPWGKIDGEVRIGREPAPHQQVEFQPGPFQRGGRWFVFTYGYTTVTDRRGRFAFDRVVPIPGTVSRSFTSAVVPLGMPASGWQERVEVKPNQTARVRIGGKGRPVIGRVAVGGTRQPPVDWTKNQPVVLHVPREELKDSLDWRQFAAHLDMDGRYRIEDVPPGKYVLEATVSGPSYPRVWHQGAQAGTAKMTVTVPEAAQGRPDDPLDLGTITVGLFESLKEAVFKALENPKLFPAAASTTRPPSSR